MLPFQRVCVCVCVCVYVWTAEQKNTARSKVHHSYNVILIEMHSPWDEALSRSPHTGKHPSLRTKQTQRMSHSQVLSEGI